MKFQKIGDTENALVEIELDKGEQAIIERGSMVYHDPAIKLQGVLNDGGNGGGLFSALGRSFVTGESMFITQVTSSANQSKIAVAPCVPGPILILDVSNHSPLLINDGAFLACGSGVNYKTRRQRISQGLFGGTGGFFIMETTGTGQVLIHSCGDVRVMEVNGNKPLIVDNDRVLAWDASLDYTIQVASGLFGFKTGEGLVNHFTGHGKVYVQTRNFKSAVLRYAPTSSK